MKYYSMNLGDFAALTQGLSTLEIGVIVRIRHMVLGEEKPVPGNRLALVLRDVPMETLQAVLNAFFVETEAGWSAPDLEQMIADFRLTVEKKRQAGTKGGKKTVSAKQELSTCQADAKQVLSTCQASAKQVPSTCQADAKQVLSTCQADAKQVLSTCQASAWHLPSTCLTTINHKPETINHKPDIGGVGEGPQASPPPAVASPSSALIPLEVGKTDAGASLSALNSFPGEDNGLEEKPYANATASPSTLKRLMPDGSYSPIPGATMTTGPVAPIAPRPEAEPQDASAGVTASSSAPAKPKRRVKVKPKIELPYTALPDEWRSIGESIDPDLDYRRVFEEFREYWLSEGKTMRDWTRVWRNRVRDLLTYPNSKARYGRSPQATPRRQQEEIKAAEARGDFYWSPPPVGKPAPEPQDEEVLQALDNMMSGFSIKKRRAA